MAANMLQTMVSSAVETAIAAALPRVVASLGARLIADREASIPGPSTVPAGPIAGGISYLPASRTPPPFLVLRV